jgi:hypothetical protein
VWLRLHTGTLVFGLIAEILAARGITDFGILVSKVGKFTSKLVRRRLTAFIEGLSPGKV